MWSGFSSEIEIQTKEKIVHEPQGRMWSGFSSEIEIRNAICVASPKPTSHVERLLI